MLRALTKHYGNSDGATLFAFWAGLTWRVDESASISYIELAFLFCRHGHSLEACPAPVATFASVQKVLKRSAVIVFDIEDQKLIFGHRDSTWAHKCGRALPKGSVRNARPFLEPKALEAFAKLFLDGRDQRMATWSFDPVNCLA